MARALIEHGHGVTMVCGSYDQGDTGLTMPFVKGRRQGLVEGVVVCGVKRDRVIMVPNGCDLEIFGAGAPRWWPEGVPPELMMAIFTGTHGQANGLDSVLDAAAVLKKRGEDRISLVRVGQGREKPRLQQRTQQEGLGMIKFVDPVAKTQLAGLMAEANLGMQLLCNVPAFYFGTLPNKFFDYLSAGLPVLNNYPGWVGEMVAANECGFVVPPNDPEAFADALVAAANEREALERIGKNARALTESEFSRSQLSREWVDWVQGAAVR